jgi:hypothetical protein
LRQTNHDLWRYYDVANRRYFKNKLDKGLPIRFAKLSPKVLGRTQVCNHGIPQCIEISERLRGFEAHTIMTMLHEMVHVEHPQWKGHGRHFDAAMLRLAKARAFAGLW